MASKIVLPGSFTDEAIERLEARCSKLVNNLETAINAKDRAETKYAQLRGKMNVLQQRIKNARTPIDIKPAKTISLPELREFLEDRRRKAINKLHMCQLDHPWKVQRDVIEKYRVQGMVLVLTELVAWSEEQ